MGDQECGAVKRMSFTAPGRLACQLMGPVVAILALWGATPALASSLAKWRLNNVPIAESAVAAKWSGTFKVTDTKVPLLGTVAVECGETAEGEVGPGAAGEVTKWTVSGCINKANCPSAALTALHLPWGSELVAIGGSANDKLLSSGKGAPGFKIVCSGLSDECTGTLSATMTNTIGGATATFVSSEKLSCTLGGVGSGTLEGAQSVEASSGKKLSAEVEEPPTWLAGGGSLASPKAVTWTGKIKLKARVPTYGSVAVTCEDTGSGKAGAGSAGEMTTWTMTHCSSEGCPAGASTIEALGLPWHTELFTSGVGVGDLITAISNGKPAYKLTCANKGVQDECAMNDFAMTNAEGGVTGVFSKEEQPCTVYTGEFEGSQTIKLTNGETLKVS